MATLRWIARLVEPLAGENKSHILYGLAKRVVALFAALILFPIGLALLPFALPFYLYAHSRRPNVSFIHNPKASGLQGVAEDTLHVRTYNVGMGYECFSALSDLRDVKVRAKELSDWIESDPNLPEVIFFQEAFHIDATRILCDGLKEKYPYVIHNIAPHVLGLNNGGVIASQHPIEEFSFRPFGNLLGPERLTTRGLLKIRIEKGGKKIDVYGTHLQALLGDLRAKIRKEQMEQIIGWIEEDQKENSSDVQFLLGDLNASKITAWGDEDHTDDKMLDLMGEEFTDVFLNDHNDVGERTSGEAQFTEKDAPDGLSEKLVEPTGSWCIGPFAEIGAALRLAEQYIGDFIRYVGKKKIKDVPRPHNWGTEQWASFQHACTARFDFILRRKGGAGTAKDDRAEIRRVKVLPGTQSAPSDHLPIDGILKIS
ncbi:endonuclease/exonuclease/phosphatase family protein [Simkania negevensis]|uniref:Endonuclease/exonuclease/phosphatase family protein n=1 Tax=Simkania negevensis TaxID=83561 RepID=A0ABS3ASY1_9BACT|nr:endonuclease/exonuclease/phosphatase family protein [Simkania negevensis]